MGTGPMTGRGAGFCAGYGVPGYANPIPRRGFGRGFGGFGGGFGYGGYGGYGGFAGRGGSGRQNRFYPIGDPGWASVPAYGGLPQAEDELDTLKSQAEYFAGALEDIKKRIEELDTGKETE